MPFNQTFKLDGKEEVLLTKHPMQMQGLFRLNSIGTSQSQQLLLGMRIYGKLIRTN